MVPTSLSGYLSPSAYQLRNHVCMIPCGGLLNDAPLKWKSDKLQYYANYILDGKPIDTLFKGFIFNGICTRDDYFIYPLFVGFGKPAEITDWQQWIEALFAPDANLHALHSLAGAEKVDVWISLPYPHPFQRNFGVVQGRKLDFQFDMDRLTASMWWLDQFISQWNKHPHLHDKLELRGFLWQREVIDDDDEMLVKWVNAVIHARKLLSMWLPNYGSSHVVNWRELGFHVTALHTNFSGDMGFDNKWITNATLFAKYFKMGVQMTIGKGMIYGDTHPLDYFNLGLEGGSSYMMDSFLVYQFPNQTLKSIYKKDIQNYIRLYLFVKGIYQKIDYPNMDY